jgi:hypothetical protein
MALQRAPRERESCDEVVDASEIIATPNHCLLAFAESYLHG